MSSSAGSVLTKLYAVFRAETKGLRPSQAIFRWVDTLTRFMGPEERANALRAIGVQVGEGTQLGAGFRVTAEANAKSKLVIGANCELGERLVLDLEERIEIGNEVRLGDDVMILTSSHELGGKERRAGPVQYAPVRICDKVTIGQRCIILPGIVVGAGATIEDHSVVAREVPPGARMRGNPAAPVKSEDQGAKSESLRLGGSEGAT
jgi:maltose O-acetyltransferase